MNEILVEDGIAIDDNQTIVEHEIKRELKTTGIKLIVRKLVTLCLCLLK